MSRFADKRRRIDVICGDATAWVETYMTAGLLSIVPNGCVTPACIVKVL